MIARASSGRVIWYVNLDPAPSDTNENFDIFSSMPQPV